MFDKSRFNRNKSESIEQMAAATMLFRTDCDYLRNYINAADPLEMEPVKAFLRKSFDALMKERDRRHYDLIVDQIRKNDDPDTVWRVLIALSGFTSLLTDQE